MQGLRLGQNILYQDNKSAILSETKGTNSSGKYMRHLDIIYFFITDMVDRGGLEVEHCPTESMIADFLTKPPQVKLFLEFRNLISGPQ